MLKSSYFASVHVWLYAMKYRGRIAALLFLRWVKTVSLRSAALTAGRLVSPVGRFFPHLNDIGFAFPCLHSAPFAETCAPLLCSDLFWLIRLILPCCEISTMVRVRLQDDILKHNYNAEYLFTSCRAVRSMMRWEAVVAPPHDATMLYRWFAPPKRTHPTVHCTHLVNFHLITHSAISQFWHRILFCIIRILLRLLHKCKSLYSYACPQFNVINQLYLRHVLECCSL